MASPKFSIVRFNQALLGHGFQVLWEKQQMCVCYNPETSEASPTCPYCGGLHYVWRPYGVIPALVVGMKEVKRQVADFTKIGQGDVTISTLPDDKLAINDRIRMVHSPEIYTETIEATYNDAGQRIFVPFYEICDIDEVTGQSNEHIDLSRVMYSSAEDAIYVSDYAGDKISIRYKHYPMLLISDLLHSNRQQWSGDVGSGSLSNLPNQYLAKRITTKLKIAYKKQLTEAGVILDLDELIQSLSVADTHKFTYDEWYKYSPLQSIQEQKFTASAFNENRFYAIELGFVQGSNGKVLTLKDDFNRVVEVQSPISSIQDIKRFKDNLVEGQKFLYLKDKYAEDFTLYEFKSGVYLTYLGGDYLNPSSWSSERPQELDNAVSQFDYRNNPDCEILVRVPTDHIYYAQPDAWKRKSPELSIFVENNELYLTYSGNQQKLSDFVKDRVNYACLNLPNNKSLNHGNLMLNGQVISFTIDKGVYNLGYRKAADLMDKTGSLTEFRVYSRALDLFEQSQNMNFIQGK